MTDTEWYSLMQTAPREGRRALIDQYGNLVYAIVLNKLKDCASREDIEDCVSDVFVAVFEAEGDFSASAGSLKSFISTIAKRTAIDAWRRLTYRNGCTDHLEDSETELSSHEEDPAQTLLRKTQKQRLWQIVKDLGEPDTSIIIRQYFYDQSAKEIAKALSMTAAAVQKRSIRARARMKELLQQEDVYSRKGEVL